MLIRNCSGAGAPHHDQRRCFYVDTSIPMSIHLEMGVARERGASLNRSGVECSIRKAEMRNGMFHKVLQSGAALLKAIVRV